MLKSYLLSAEEIIGWFDDAGWRVTAWERGENALVGYAEEENVFILAHESEMESIDPTFELYDGKFRLSGWVRVVPTPRQAAVLLREQ